MAGSLNRVQLIGNIGKDPEIKQIPSGTSVCKFSIATSEYSKSSDGAAGEKTEWHNIVCWGKLAEVCGQYLKKGKKVYLEGRLQTSNWEKDGQKHYKTEVVADKVVFLDSRGSGVSGDEQGTSQSAAVDDIPF